MSIITVRTDEETQRAIDELTADGLFRPGIEIDGHPTRVLVEQARAVDRSRLGDPVRHLTFEEFRAVETALRLMLAP